mmetsp:Transcript_7577/g.18411  ORF Transcript_7577/g.18411 Transcript_7577/m.18411 type:complete len:359 (-) Transcript_7577:169-1245(-)
MKPFQRLQRGVRQTSQQPSLRSRPRSTFQRPSDLTQAPSPYSIQTTPKPTHQRSKFGGSRLSNFTPIPLLKSMTRTPDMTPLRLDQCRRCLSSPLEEAASFGTQHLLPFELQDRSPRSPWLCRRVSLPSPLEEAAPPPLSSCRTGPLLHAAPAGEGGSQPELSLRLDAPRERIERNNKKRRTCVAACACPSHLKKQHLLPFELQNRSPTQRRLATWAPPCSPDLGAGASCTHHLSVLALPRKQCLRHRTSSHSRCRTAPPRGPGSRHGLSCSPPRSHRHASQSPISGQKPAAQCTNFRCLPSLLRKQRLSAQHTSSPSSWRTASSPQIATLALLESTPLSPHSHVCRRHINCRYHSPR